VGSLTALEGGKGYWMILDEYITLTFENGCDEQECISLSRELSQRLAAYPIGYEFSQSTEQAFYFIGHISGIKIGDWVLAYNNDIVVGAREWIGAYTDIPVMGDDGNIFTKGYMETGLKPQFKILRDGELIELEDNLPQWSNNTLHMVDNLRMLPESFNLSAAYPNPFNPTTTLSFALPIDSKVYLSIYNLQGREVASLVNSNLEAGYHSVVWDANSYASGVYFVKMVAGEFVNTQKLMLIK
jgi:hypothetical protein